MDHVIEIRDISKVYSRDFLDFEYGKLKLRFKERRVDALKKVNLNVEKGEIFGLLGPNGAGKSTLIKILMTIHFPTSGEAAIFGEPYWKSSAKKRIGFLPENPYFYDYLTGDEFLNFYGQMYDMSAETRKKRIPEVLELVGLHTYDIDQLPLKGYSKGMLQRIGLAQAILSDPELVILDEPLSGLDPIGRKELRDIILMLKEQGKTIFFSSHILQDAESICDRVGILFKGELTNVGKLNELLSTDILGYEILVSRSGTMLEQHFQDKAEKVLAQEKEVLFFFDNKTDINVILKSMMEKDASAKILSVTPRRETLEDYFIKKVRS